MEERKIAEMIKAHFWSTSFLFRFGFRIIQICCSWFLENEILFECFRSWSICSHLLTVASEFHWVEETIRPDFVLTMSVLFSASPVDSIRPSYLWDALSHRSYQDIEQVCKLAKRSDSRFLLISTTCTTIQVHSTRTKPMVLTVLKRLTVLVTC